MWKGSYKRLHGGCRRCTQKSDNFTLTALRNSVHDFFCRNELPTVRKIAAESANVNAGDLSILQS